MSKKTVSGSSSILRSTSQAIRGMELPDDALLLIYVAVFARQYCWWLTNNNKTAWATAGVVAALIGWLYFSTKEREAESPGRARLPFWLVVVLPLALVYLLRFVFPDVSFDVLNYRLLHAERALRGYLYLPGEFFPTPAPFNPAPDMVTGLFRHALGYRLGTIVNLLAMIWAARITDKVLRPHLRNAWLRSSGVLLAMLAEHLLFEINNYMIDLLALPLTLEATYLALRHTQFKNKPLNFVAIAGLLGMSVAFKLTNAAVALPIILLCAYQALFSQSSAGRETVRHSRRLVRTTVICAGVFMLPLIPFTIYLYQQTGSPVFPVYNGVFKSIYWPVSNVLDPRWGGESLQEKLLWPILMIFKPERISELQVYSGRISLGCVAGLIGLVYFRRDARLRVLCLIFFSTALLWSISTGYIRYGLYIEVMAAVVLLAVVARLTDQTRRWTVAFAVACLLGLIMVVQTLVASYYVSQSEWAGRPTFISRPGPYAREAHYLLSDRSLRNFLSNEERGKFDRVEVWIMSSIKTSGLEVMLKRDAPIIGVKNGEYFRTKEGQDRFAAALQKAAGRRMFTLAFSEDLDAAKMALHGHGLVETRVEAIDIPFYSPNLRLPVFLVEVKNSRENLVGKSESTSEVTPAAFPANVYRAELSTLNQPTVMKAGAREVIHLKVKNVGRGVWPSRVAKGWFGIVTAGDRWLAADGRRVVNELDSRIALPHDLKPGEILELVLPVTAPLEPGQYIVEIDMVHEGVTWFYQQGSSTLQWKVKVEK
jgi:hypothetical protein